jgi:hypothetical protein
LWKASYSVRTDIIANLKLIKNTMLPEKVSIKSIGNTNIQYTFIIPTHLNPQPSNEKKNHVVYV